MTRSNWAARGLALLALIGVGTLAVQEIKVLSPQNQTAAGVDNDHNGIRDEVDDLIAREFQASPAQTIYAQRLARVLQVEASLANSTHQQAVKIFEEELLEIGCLRYNTAENLRSTVVPKLTSATFNTSERLRNNQIMEFVAGSDRFGGVKGSDCEL